MIARILRRAAIGIAALGLLAPPTLLLAAEPPTTEGPKTTDAAVISDVALGAKGTLRGQVVDAAGAAVPGVNITVRQHENVLARTTSSPQGKFEIVGLPGGIFQITTDQSDASLRLWAAKTAPPGARSSVLVVHDQAAVRGQSALGRLFARPLAIGALVVTAVAIPVVIHQIDIDRKSGS